MMWFKYIGYAVGLYLSYIFLIGVIDLCLRCIFIGTYVYLCVKGSITDESFKTVRDRFQPWISQLELIRRLVGL